MFEDKLNAEQLLGGTLAYIEFVELPLNPTIHKLLSYYCTVSDSFSNQNAKYFVENLKYDLRMVISLINYVNDTPNQVIGNLREKVVFRCKEIQYKFLFSLFNEFVDSEFTINISNKTKKETTLEILSQLIDKLENSKSAESIYYFSKWKKEIEIIKSCFEKNKAVPTLLSIYVISKLKSEELNHVKIANCGAELLIFLEKFLDDEENLVAIRDDSDNHPLDYINIYFDLALFNFKKNVGEFEVINLGRYRTIKESIKNLLNVNKVEIVEENSNFDKNITPIFTVDSDFVKDLIKNDTQTIYQNTVGISPTYCGWINELFVDSFEVSNDDLGDMIDFYSKQNNFIDQIFTLLTKIDTNVEYIEFSVSSFSKVELNIVTFLLRKTIFKKNNDGKVQLVNIATLTQFKEFLDRRSKSINKYINNRALNIVGYDIITDKNVDDTELSRQKKTITEDILLEYLRNHQDLEFDHQSLTEQLRVNYNAPITTVKDILKNLYDKEIVYYDSKIGRYKINGVQIGNLNYTNEKNIVSLTETNQVNEVLNLTGFRQHKFDFLLGDAGTKLPVDIYYPTLNLVIEYRETQHVNPVKHFDKPDKITVSGVSRGEQRKLYDQRRRDVLPQNKIQLIEINYYDFTYDSKNRIVREREKDLNLVTKMLKF